VSAQALPGQRAQLVPRPKPAVSVLVPPSWEQICSNATLRVNGSDAVELAIWFHDAIYNFPAYENEKLSAAFFMEKSANLLGTRFRESVEALIIATEHIRPPEDPDQRILVDVDLSSFGLPWDQFAADGKNIRQELHYLSDAEFYAGQIAFMEALLSRERIFNTAHFHDSYEAKARENVSRYLHGLSERGYCCKK